VLPRDGSTLWVAAQRLEQVGPAAAPGGLGEVAGDEGGAVLGRQQLGQGVAVQVGGQAAQHAGGGRRGIADRQVGVDRDDQVHRMLGQQLEAHVGGFRGAAVTAGHQRRGAHQQAPAIAQRDGAGAPRVHRPCLAQLVVPVVQQRLAIGR
jgi:hypothetical protein